MMREVSHSLLKWIGSLNSVDVPGENRFHRFILSARLGLWPAILLSSFAFGHLLGSEFVLIAVLSVNLCLVASVAFLFNDACDAKVDEMNNVPRWSIRISLDLWLFLGTVGTCLFAIATAWFWISTPAFLGLITALIVSFGYSLFCKKIFLLGNVVAAVLSISPGLIMAVDAYTTEHENGTFPETAFAFLGAAFLLLMSREIKFDEFDIIGDRFGRRNTVPMFLSGSALRVLHTLACASGLAILLFILAVAGKSSWPANLTLALVTCGFCAALTIVAYRANSKEKFYKTTRLVMLVIPISMLLSF
jgi:4-hydroxybenzoate polyprenyltransferase